MRLACSLVLMLLSLALAACGGDNSSASDQIPVSADYTYSVPLDSTDGWATGDLADHGIDSEKITAMINAILDGSYSGIDSVVIVRDSTLLLSELFRQRLDEYDSWIGNQSLSRHIMHSTSKSVSSALIGIAIDQGYIASVDVPFYDLFGYTSYENWDIRKSEMTLEDALTMRLGLQWDEWSAPYGDPRNDLQKLTSGNEDYTKALLDLPSESDPGTTYAYNTAATIAIGQALENATGVSMASFAETQLFAPLQITTARWGRTPTGLANGGSGLFLEPRDMAKFGQLFISEGVWNGQQVISKAWVQNSTARHVALSWANTSGYGYQWWRDKFRLGETELDTWSTRGYGGQYIFCIPSLRLVVAFTGQNYDNGLADTPFTLVQNFILPALRAEN